MTITPITSPTRSRLRAVRNRHPAPVAPPQLPYRWTWLHNRDAGLWTLVVRVRATGQQLSVSYRTAVKPSDRDGEHISARMMRFAKGTGQ